MEKHRIRTATACYTGGNIYIYYGQLESGLYFRTFDDSETIYICDSNTEAEEADYSEFYDSHTVEELTGDDFTEFWNTMLSHILNKGEALGEWSNYDPDDIKSRLIK